MPEFNGRVGHLIEIESPWANAGGVARSLEEVELLAQSGIGWVEAGSFTPEGRLGNGANGEKVYYHNALTGETVNSFGMPNKGMDIVVTEIPEMKRITDAYNKKLVINVAPVSSDPVAESLELTRRAYAAGADAVLLNAGCPNVVTEEGGRHEILSRSPTELLDVLKALGGLKLPVFLRISPQETYGDMRKVCDAVRLSGAVSALFTPNTWPGYVPLDPKTGKPILEVPGGAGGLSGPAKALDAATQTNWAIVALKGSKVDVVRSSSIMNGRELGKSLDDGAVGGAGTTFFFESEYGWKDDTNRFLSELAEIS